MTGAVVSGGADATFLLEAVFSGDGDANAMVLARGQDGWGLLDRASPSSHSLSVDPNGTAWYEAAFRDGLLVTSEENPFFDNADGGEFPVVSYWRITDGDFVLDHDNVTEASPTTTPPLPATAMELPDDCPGNPPDGTYLTSVAAEGDLRKNDVAGDEVTLTFPSSVQVPASAPSMPMRTFQPPSIPTRAG